MSKRLLWLDDYRNPMEDQWLVFSPITTEDLEVHWVKSYNEFTKWIETNDLPDAICFDHDLGGDIIREVADNGFKTFKNTKDIKEEKTGYDAAKWLILYCMLHDKELPLYNIQSANPVGKQNIDNILQNYLKSLK